MLHFWNCPNWTLVGAVGSNGDPATTLEINWERLANEIEGTTLWSRGVTITALIVAMLSPFMGAIADRGGYRKAFLFATTVIAAAGSLGLYWVVPGQVFWALFLRRIVSRK